MPRPSPEAYFERLRQMARARGGRLLSRRYLGDTIPLRFRCAEGHEWRGTPGKIKQGRWCPACGRVRMAAAQRAATSTKHRRLVARRGGVVLSSEYVNYNTRLRYRCRKGHEWETVPAVILRGGWCPVCAMEVRKASLAESNRHVLLRLQRLVSRRGGRILPPGYSNYRVRLRLRCARGHTWTCLPETVDAGGWCPGCRHELQLARLREIAERWGGVCLSTRFRTDRDRLTWRCVQGHRFCGTVAFVKHGGWCARCRGVERGNVERMREIALERGGRCLSSRYVDAETKLSWRCGQGHAWRSTPGSIVQGTWCPRCRVRDGHSLRRLSIELMRQAAAEMGGECLSREYHASKVPLKWRCGRGHMWMAHPFRIRQGHWCPACAFTARGTLDGMRALAIERGGRCLTRVWNDHRQPLRFECARGHRFDARSSAVKSGLWCRTCRPVVGIRDTRRPRAPIRA